MEKHKIWMLLAQVRAVLRIRIQSFKSGTRSGTSSFKNVKNKKILNALNFIFETVLLTVLYIEQRESEREKKVKYYISFALAFY